MILNITYLMSTSMSVVNKPFMSTSFLHKNQFIA